MCVGLAVRKIALSPLEGWILAELEEAGAEDVTTVLNAAHPRSRDEVEDAIRRLVALGMVELAYADERGWPNVEGREAEERLALVTWVRWESRGGYWTVHPGVRNVALVRTAKKH